MGKPDRDGFRLPHWLNRKREVAMTTEPKTVAEQVQEISEGWNPPPRNRDLELLVGVNPSPGDTRATDHVPMEELNMHMQPTDSNVDAQRMGEFTDDMDSLDEYTVDELKAEIDRRNEDGREVMLKKSGTKAELIARLEEDDANGGHGEVDEDDEE